MQKLLFNTGKRKTAGLESDCSIITLTEKSDRKTSSTHWIVPNFENGWVFLGYEGMFLELDIILSTQDYFRKIKK